MRLLRATPFYSSPLSLLPRWVGRPPRTDSEVGASYCGTVVEHIPVYLHRDNISVYYYVNPRNCESLLTYQIVIQTMPRYMIRKWVICQSCDAILYAVMCLLYFVSHYINGIPIGLSIAIRGSMLCLCSTLH